MAVSFDELGAKAQAFELWRITKDEDQRHIVARAQQNSDKIRDLENRPPSSGPQGTSSCDKWAAKSKGLNSVDKYLGGSSSKFEEWPFHVRQFFDSLDPGYAASSCHMWQCSQTGQLATCQQVCYVCSLCPSTTCTEFHQIWECPGLEKTAAIRATLPYPKSFKPKFKSETFSLK